MVEAHFISAAYTFFEISDNGTPGSHVPPNDRVSNDKKAEYITRVTQQFVDQYASHVINFDFCALLNNSPEDGTDVNVQSQTQPRVSFSMNWTIQASGSLLPNKNVLALHSCKTKKVYYLFSLQHFKLHDKNLALSYVSPLPVS